MNDRFLYICMILATLFADIHDFIFGNLFFYSIPQIIFINFFYLLLPSLALIFNYKNKIKKKKK
jgi:hypothetical protein